MPHATTKRMARKSQKRNDPHRPGAIIPAHYEYVFSFSLASSEGGWPIPSEGINCELDGRRWEKDADGKERCINGKHRDDGNCCVIGLRAVRRERFALGGGPGKCTVCGAHYIHGDAWRHIPTGEIVFLGQDCAAKYEMLADRSEHELRMGRLRAAAAVQCEKARRAEAYLAFCEAHEGLAAALELEHYLLADLKRKLREHGALSDKQVALAFKIEQELKNPRPVDVHVPAPTGKQTFRGTVVSDKAMEGSYGVSIKITVKVTTPGGVWLAWGTAPALILDQARKHRRTAKGCEVEITATLKAGREPHFAIMGRPRGEVLTFPCEKPESCEGCERARLGHPAYELREFIRLQRQREENKRAAGLFDQAVYAQWLADEAERTGRLPAADLSGRTPDYYSYRTAEN